MKAVFHSGDHQPYLKMMMRTQTSPGLQLMWRRMLGPAPLTQIWNIVIIDYRNVLMTFLTNNIFLYMVTYSYKPQINTKIQQVFHMRKVTFTYYVIIFDLKNLVPFGHKELWRPLAANRDSCDFIDVVAYGHNQLWRLTVAKFCNM